MKNSKAKRHPIATVALTLFFVVLCILFLIMVDIIQERCVIRDKLSQMNIVVRWAVYFAGIFAVIIFGMYGPGYNAAAFIYQQF